MLSGLANPNPLQSTSQELGSQGWVTLAGLQCSAPGFRSLTYQLRQDSWPISLCCLLLLGRFLETSLLCRSFPSVEQASHVLSSLAVLTCSNSGILLSFQSLKHKGTCILDMPGHVHTHVCTHVHQQYKTSKSHTDIFTQYFWKFSFLCMCRCVCVFPMCGPEENLGYHCQ